LFSKIKSSSTHQTTNTLQGLIVYIYTPVHGGPVPNKLPDDHAESTLTIKHFAWNQLTAVVAVPLETPCARSRTPHTRTWPPDGSRARTSIVHPPPLTSRRGGAGTTVRSRSPPAIRSLGPASVPHSRGSSGNTCHPRPTGAPGEGPSREDPCDRGNRSSAEKGPRTHRPPGPRESPWGLLGSREPPMGPRLAGTSPRGGDGNAPGRSRRKQEPCPKVRAFLRS
jgi:hypothetical protein